MVNLDRNRNKNKNAVSTRISKINSNSNSNNNIISHQKMTPQEIKHHFEQHLCQQQLQQQHNLPIPYGVNKGSANMDSNKSNGDNGNNPTMGQPSSTPQSSSAS